MDPFFFFQLVVNGFSCYVRYDSSYMWGWFSLWHYSHFILIYMSFQPLLSVTNEMNCPLYSNFLVWKTTSTSSHSLTLLPLVSVICKRWEWFTLGFEKKIILKTLIPRFSLENDRIGELGWCIFFFFLHNYSFRHRYPRNDLLPIKLLIESVIANFFFQFRIFFKRAYIYIYRIYLRERTGSHLLYKNFQWSPTVGSIWRWDWGLERFIWDHPRYQVWLQSHAPNSFIRHPQV